MGRMTANRFYFVLGTVLAGLGAVIVSGAVLGEPSVLPWFDADDALVGAGIAAVGAVVATAHRRARSIDAPRRPDG